MSRAFEDDLFLAIARAPKDAGPRAVLADALNERGEPWGAFMQAELSRDTEPARYEAVRAAAWPSMVEALGGVPGAVEVLETRWGLPARVHVGPGELDSAGAVWAVVEQLRFAPEAEVTALLQRGFTAHGWPCLFGLTGVTLDALAPVASALAGRLTHLALVDVPRDLAPADVTQLLSPDCLRLAVTGRVDVSLGRQSVLEGDVWVSGGLLWRVGEEEAALLAALLAPFMQPGIDVFWNHGSQPPELLERALSALPEHTLRWNGPWR